MSELRPAAVSLVFIFTCGMGSTAAGAQTASVRGVVSDSLTGDALSGARIQVVAEGGEIARALSDGRGRFLIVGLPWGRYTFTANRVGHRPYRLTRVFLDRADVTLTVAMSALAVRLDPIVVTDSRSEGTLLSAEASVSGGVPRTD